ncbi:MAG TPA: hypothetical protein VE623_18715 [Acidimicrobiales bacterium]|nr:hypothetical protein [Acidimicrobiales bacterium]
MIGSVLLRSRPYEIAERRAVSGFVLVLASPTIATEPLIVAVCQGPGPSRHQLSVSGGAFLEAVGARDRAGRPDGDDHWG